MKIAHILQRLPVTQTVAQQDLTTYTPLAHAIPAAVRDVMDRSVPRGDIHNLAVANLSDTTVAMSALRQWRAATVFLGSARTREGDVCYADALHEGQQLTERFWSSLGAARPLAIVHQQRLQQMAARCGGNPVVARALQDDVMGRAGAWLVAYRAAQAAGGDHAAAFLSRGIAARTGAGPGTMEAPLKGALLEHASHLLAVAVRAELEGDHTLSAAAFAAAQKKSPVTSLLSNNGEPWLRATPTADSQALATQILRGGVETQGFGIKLPHEQELSPWVENVLELDQFFFRMFGLFENAVNHVVLPGGYGTLAEALELWFMKGRDGYDDPLLLDRRFYSNLVTALDKGRSERPGLITDQQWGAAGLRDGAGASMPAGTRGFSAHPDDLETRLVTEQVDVCAKLAAMPPGVVFLAGRLHHEDPAATTMIAAASQLAKAGHSARLAGLDDTDARIAATMRREGSPTAQVFALTGDVVDAHPAVNVAATVSDVVTQKIGLTRNIVGVVAGPGDVQALSTVFSLLTDVQTKKIDAVPIVLVGKSYWQPIFDAIAKDLLEGPVAMISPEDLRLVVITDDPADVVKAFPQRAIDTTRSWLDVRIGQP
jgi:predicted Rossmann-fold nucleotide-binding protein